ncbi:MAG: hypothetical protein M1830_003056, partial [Pleopsidium flavum]
MAGFAEGEDAGAEEGDSTPVMYEELAEIEKQFDDIEVEIIRKQNTLTTSIYAKRAALISRIPNFWPLVLEQAPPDIDTYIQPSDSELLGSLKDLHVERFEITPGPAVGAHGPTSLSTNGTDGKGGGDPR